MIQHFDSELEEGWKNGYCLICKCEKCKHLIRYRNKNPSPATKEQLKRLGIGSGNIPVKRKKKELKYPKGHLFAQLNSKPIPEEEKEQNKERANSKVGFGVKRMDGFIGERKKWWC